MTFRRKAISDHVVCLQGLQNNRSVPILIVDIMLCVTVTVVGGRPYICYRIVAILNGILFTYLFPQTCLWFCFDYVASGDGLNFLASQSVAGETLISYGSPCQYSAVDSQIRIDKLK